MIQLAGEVFDSKNDPDQLDVDEKIISRLLEIHPSCVSEYDDGNGPVVWILIFPTTLELMEKFIRLVVPMQRPPSLRQWIFFSNDNLRFTYYFR